MASQPASQPEQATQTAPPVKPRRKRGMSQERVMLLLTGFFTTGVLIYTLVPAGPARVAAITCFAFGLVWALNKGLSTP